MKTANIYDLCDAVIRDEEPVGEPGENLRLLYNDIIRNFLLKTFVLRGSRHPLIPMTEVKKYQEMIRLAMRADYRNWQDKSWIMSTFHPIAELLDKVESPPWQEREKVPLVRDCPSAQTVLKKTMADVLRVWKKDPKQPYFPVAAQLILSGDDLMDGKNFLSILTGLGSFEYQNITMLFALVRCFVMANPSKLKILRKPFVGICEKMFSRYGWIWHRTAFYDAIFFEQLLQVVTKVAISEKEFTALIAIMQELLFFMIVTSREESETPGRKIAHPAITCLPKGPRGEPLCHFSKSDWEIKRKLGFSDYVPDMDTTFLSLSMAKKWLNLVSEKNLTVDQTLLQACEQILRYPYIQIIEEYQIGSDLCSIFPTIHITKPLDYTGAVPLWFDKSFAKPDGREVNNALGNEVCPGHNMDILESILVNKQQWDAFSPQHLPVVQRLLEFHYRAYISGNFKESSAFKYYLPEMYLYYTGRMYDIFLGLSAEEQTLLDPQQKVAQIRKIALDYCRNELISATLNPFDASLAVAALVLLQYESKEDGVIATGVKAMLDKAGEAWGHPYHAYEWNRMRHPTRIIVGSEVSTSFFVMNALTLSSNY